MPQALKKMKKGVRIINCARGGLVDEKALRMRSRRHVAGAAFDVFVEEPATRPTAVRPPNVICTPHLGASTTEAQENVALQVAEQMSDYLLTGRDLQCGQLPVDHGGGSAEAEAVRRARRKARLVRWAS
jgi:phosphoglycerate dehydrogenase-like enzyme